MYRRVCQAAKRPESIFWCRVGGTAYVGFIIFLRREMSIHCSGMNLDSGLFRVVQCRSSMRAKGREKTGMTLLKIVYNEMQNALLWAFIMCFFLTEMLYIGCAEGATSSGRSPGRSVGA